MKTKTMTVVGVVVLILIGVAMLLSPSGGTQEAKKNTPVESSGGSLTLSETDYDFGTIQMQAGPVSKIYDITNDSDEAVSIGRIYTSCACTTAYLTDAGKEYGKFGMPGHDGMRSAAGITLQPGKTVTLKALFDPAFHGPAGVGLAERTVYIETNSRTHPKLELSFRATVIR